MIRANIIRAARPLVSRRLLSSTTRAMAEGDTGAGASRAGGIRSGDAFTKREQAEEERFIRQEERTKLQAIREKLKAEREHIDALDKSLEEMLQQERASGQGESQQ